MPRHSFTCATDKTGAGTSDVRSFMLVLPNAERSEFLRRCQWMEPAGFGGLSLCDHLVDWVGGTGPWLELRTQTRLWRRLPLKPQ